MFNSRLSTDRHVSGQGGKWKDFILQTTWAFYIANYMVIIQKIDTKKWNWGGQIANRQKSQRKWRPLNERIVCVCVCVFVCKNQSHYRPEVPRRVPGSLCSQITWQWPKMVVRLSALCTGRFYLQKYYWCSFLLEAESTPGP